jgi:hypothetical protein
LSVEEAITELDTEVCKTLKDGMVVAGVEEGNLLDILSDHLCRRVRTRGERDDGIAEQPHVLVNLDICANTLSLDKTVH